MELTRELLTERRTELEEQRLQTIANLNAVDGAIQQVDWSLEQLDIEEPAE